MKVVIRVWSVIGLTVSLVAIIASAVFAQDEGSQAYTVQPGDSLARIAANHNTSIDALILLNALDNPNQLSVGQVIRVPSTTGVQPEAIDESDLGDVVNLNSQLIHTVEQGDSLAKIAKDAGITISDLIQINQLSSDVLQLGQQLIVGYEEALVAPTTVPPVVPVYANPPLASEITIFFQMPKAAEGWISGPPEFIAETSEALGWLAAYDPSIYTLAQTYITEIVPSTHPTRATATHQISNGTCKVGMIQGDRIVVASMIYHEALHCAHFIRGVSLTEEQEEAYAFAHQLEFAKRHNMSQAFIDSVEQQWYLFVNGFNPYKNPSNGSD